MQFILLLAWHLREGVAGYPAMQGGFVCCNIRQSERSKLLSGIANTAAMNGR